MVDAVEREGYIVLHDRGPRNQPRQSDLPLVLHPEPGHHGTRAGYDGAKKKRGSKVHLAAKVQETTGDAVELAYVDQGYTGREPALDADD